MTDAGLLQAEGTVLRLTPDGKKAVTVALDPEQITIVEELDVNVLDDALTRAASVALDTRERSGSEGIASEPKALLAVLKNPAYRFKRIGLEAGPLSQWLFSALAEAELAVGRRSVPTSDDDPRRRPRGGADLSRHRRPTRSLP